MVTLVTVELEEPHSPAALVAAMFDVLDYPWAALILVAVEVEAPDSQAESAVVGEVQVLLAVAEVEAAGSPMAEPDPAMPVAEGMSQKLTGLDQGWTGVGIEVSQVALMTHPR